MADPAGFEPATLCYLLLQLFLFLGGRCAIQTAPRILSFGIKKRLKIFLEIIISDILGAIHLSGWLILLLADHTMQVILRDYPA